MHWLGFTAGANPALTASLSSGVEKRASFRPEALQYYQYTLTPFGGHALLDLPWFCNPPPRLSNPIR